ncbi:MAG: GTPase Era [Desulfohalobiaceae bacterium]|nr:GTPase Era [Desulfohalobiaceae bacterium]
MNPLQPVHSRPGFHSGTCAIIGPPNSGKSTLLNTFLGQKVSIVTPKPQTTRNRISGILNQAGAQIVFLDTPGIHHTTQTLNRFIVDTAWQTLAEADCLLLVLDAALYTRKGKHKLHADLAPFSQRIQQLGLPLLLALNKIDCIRNRTGLLPLMEQLSGVFPDVSLYPISASTGDGTETLVQACREALPESMPLFPDDQLSTLPMRFFAQEIIREKLFLVLNQELPYSIAVEIENWQELPEKGLTLIQAIIYVARSQHKQIVIGKQGARLKQVGQEARLELNTLLGQRAHLELWVKVKPKWYENRSFLEQLLPESL